MPTQKSKQRKVDVLIEESAHQFTKRLSLVANSKIQVWKVMIIVFFVTGSITALTWNVSVSSQGKIQKVTPGQAYNSLSCQINSTQLDEANQDICFCPKYLPEKWNDGGWIQTDNDCYSYAWDYMLTGMFDSKEWTTPGCPSGQCAETTQCQDIYQAAQRDGMIAIAGVESVCPSGMHKVLLAIHNDGTGYHFYRQDSNGQWSHKNGTYPVRNTDYSGNIIYNPDQANLGSFQKCGYLCACGQGGSLMERKEISLKQGWNIFSSYLKPNNPDMLAVLQPLMFSRNLEKVIDENDDTIEYINNSWVNQIGNLSYTEGYYIKVKRDAKLTIYGKEEKLPWAIPLQKGKNIIGFANIARDGLKVLQSLIARDTLIKAIDEKGNTIEKLFGKWHNYIGNFNADEGYIIMVNKPTVLNITKW